MTARPDLPVTLLCLAAAVLAWGVLGVQVLRLAARFAGGAL